MVSVKVDDNVFAIVSNILGRINMLLTQREEITREINTLVAFLDYIWKNVYEGDVSIVSGGELRLSIVNPNTLVVVDDERKVE